MLHSDDPSQSARHLIHTGRAPQAVQMLQPVLASQPANWELWCLLSWALTESPGIPDAQRHAEDAARRAAALAPDHEWPYRLLSSICLLQHRVAEAVTNAEAAVARNPDWFPAWVTLTNALSVVPSRRRDARIAAQTAVKLAPPADADAYLTLAALLAEDGELDQAEQAVRHVLADRPDEVDALRMLSQIQERRGQSEAAVGTLQAAIAADPTRQHPRSLVDEKATGWLQGAIATLACCYALIAAIMPDVMSTNQALLSLSLSLVIVAVAREVGRRYKPLSAYLKTRLRRSSSGITAILLAVASLLTVALGSGYRMVVDGGPDYLRVATLIALAGYLMAALAAGRASADTIVTARRDAFLPDPRPAEAARDRWRIAAFVSVGHTVTLVILAGVALLPRGVLQAVAVLVFLILAMADGIFAAQLRESAGWARSGATLLTAANWLVGGLVFGWIFATLLVALPLAPVYIGVGVTSVLSVTTIGLRAIFGRAPA